MTTKSVKFLEDIVSFLSVIDLKSHRSMIFCDIEKNENEIAITKKKSFFIYLPLRLLISSRNLEANS